MLMKGFLVDVYDDSKVLASFHMQGLQSCVFGELHAGPALCGDDLLLFLTLQ